MIKRLNASADRLLGLLVPATEARAACSGTYNLCSGSCSSTRRKLYFCTVKSNCTDTCSYRGCYC